MAEGTEKEETTSSSPPHLPPIPPPTQTLHLEEDEDNLSKNYTSTASISVSYKKNNNSESDHQFRKGDTNLLVNEKDLSHTDQDDDEASALVHIIKYSTSPGESLGKVPNPQSRERSKTPPPNLSSAKHSQKGFSDFLFGDGDRNKGGGGGPAGGPAGDQESSRDSGVHLDCTTSGLGHDKPRDHDGDDGENCSRQSKSSSLPHGVKLCPEGNSASTSAEERSANLEQELFRAQNELKERDAEVEILKGIRQQVEGELEDLTASLFVEAHKMVTAAKMKEVASEKSLTETRMQLEGLQAEVSALKALLITSTPSRPNLGNCNGNGISLFKKQHKRTPSHNHLQYGRNEDEAGGNEKGKQPSEVVIDRAHCDVDPILLAHFAAWRVDPNLIREGSVFLEKIYTEDIDPCLSFEDQGLVNRLKKAIEENSVWVEPLPEKDRNNVPKDCALLKCPRVCHYRMRFAFDSEEWFDISQICRDRIAAVCEFLNYLRYTKNGLVKASVEDAYWEMLRLRKQMAIAKLGISIS